MTDEITTTPPLGADAPTFSAPAESSVNDVQGWRQQDQRIAELSAALDLVDALPWECRDLGGEASKAVLASSIDLTSDQPCRILSHMLSLASFPVAAAGSYQGLATGAGRYYVQVGNSRVSCQTEERMKELTVALNTKTWAAIAPHRAMLLGALRAAVLQKPQHLSKHRWSAFASNQCCLFFEHEAHAKAVAKQLNTIYITESEPDRAHLVTSMLAAIGPVASS